MSKELIRLRNIRMAFDDEVVLNDLNLYIDVYKRQGTILLERPGQRTCGSTMRSGTCGSCWILSESTLSCLNLKNPGECPPRCLTGIISSSKLRVAIRNNKRPDPSGLLPFLSAQERAWPGAPSQPRRLQQFILLGSGHQLRYHAPDLLALIEDFVGTAADGDVYKRQPVI